MVRFGKNSRSKPDIVSNHVYNLPQLEYCIVVTQERKQKIKYGTFLILPSDPSFG